MPCSLLVRARGLRQPLARPSPDYSVFTGMVRPFAPGVFGSVPRVLAGQARRLTTSSPFLKLALASPMPRRSICTALRYVGVGMAGRGVPATLGREIHSGHATVHSRTLASAPSGAGAIAHQPCG